MSPSGPLVKSKPQLTPQVKYHLTILFPIIGPQGFHSLEKYLNLEGFLEKSLKLNYALKVLENHSKALKSP